MTAEPAVAKKTVLQRHYKNINMHN